MMEIMASIWEALRSAFKMADKTQRRAASEDEHQIEEDLAAGHEKKPK